MATISVWLTAPTSFSDLLCIGLKKLGYLEFKDFQGVKVGFMYRRVKKGGFVFAPSGKGHVTTWSIVKMEYAKLSFQLKNYVL